MEQNTAFERFAPAILRVYRRDKEAFWAAVMAPFLANQVSFLACSLYLGKKAICINLPKEKYNLKAVEFSRKKRPTQRSG